MLIIIAGVIAGFISIFILTARFTLVGSRNKKLLCLLSAAWLVSLFTSGFLLAVDASKTYVPAVMRKVGYWVVAGTGRFAGWEYDVAKDMVGTPPVVMFLLIVLVFSVYGFAFAGSVATGVNMARRATNIPLKICCFLLWFFNSFFSGIITVGILPVVLAIKSRPEASLSRHLQVFTYICAIIFLYYFLFRLIPRLL